jgi:hypothetical protein
MERKAVVMKITKPGIYHDMPTADYFADCCPTPSLTQSIAKILLERSPLHAWHAHPRLNPDYRHDDDTKFDVGNIAHALLIGRGKDLVVLDFDDWRTKAAKEAREAAAADGKLAVLGKKFAIARAMADAAHEGLNLVGCGDAFKPENGNGEIVVAWQEGPLWFRTMIDWAFTDHRLNYDLKTTGSSVAPHMIDRLMVTAGWDIQAAFQERGLDAVDPTNAGRRTFRFVAQEDEPPYALTVCELSEDVMTMGRKKADHAIRIWNDCMARNLFPAYPTEIAFPQYPGWAEQQWLDREIKEAASERRPKQFDPEILMAG